MHSATSSEGSRLVRTVGLCAQTRVAIEARRHERRLFRRSAKRATEPRAKQEVSWTVLCHIACHFWCTLYILVVWKKKKIQPLPPSYEPTYACRTLNRNILEWRNKDTYPYNKPAHQVTWKTLLQSPASQPMQIPVLLYWSISQRRQGLEPHLAVGRWSRVMPPSTLGSTYSIPGVYRLHTMCTHLYGMEIGI